MRSSRKLVFAAAALWLAALLGTTAAVAGTNVNQVLVLSIDGMHAVDLAIFVKNHPDSAMASLVQTGYNYTSASTPKPADSFPGLVALFTGASPLSSGVYFDRSYDRTLWPPNVTSGPTGTQVNFDESVDLNSLVLDGGGGLNTNALPRDPARGGAVVYPHNYLRVNTVFEIAKAAGLRTAWIDKHLTDEVIQGPSGQGVDDLYVPEIAANNEFGTSYNKSVDATEDYDDMKVQALLNQIDGMDHTGATFVGVPAIFGMNFQAVSVAQKIKKNRDIYGTQLAAPYNTGGYLDGAATPSILVSNALVHTDASLAEIIQALKDNQLFDSTLIVLTAKHGQSPIDPTTLTILSPTVVTSVIDPIAQVVQATEDDAALIWLADQSKTTAAAAALLASQPTASLQDVMSGERLKLAFGDPAVDPRVPDIIAIGKPGTIYTTSSSKAAEHGGFSAQDINVPIVISHPSLAAQTIKAPVTIMQIAPTILQVLGLNPYALQAVQAERTSVLPGFEAAQLALLSISPSLGVSGASTVHLVNGQAQFQVGIAQEQHFAVQASTDLSHWTSFATNTLSINATMSVTDPDAGSFTNRFYRAMAVP